MPIINIACSSYSREMIFKFHAITFKNEKRKGKMGNQKNEIYSQVRIDGREIEEAPHSPSHLHIPLSLEKLPQRLRNVETTPTHLLLPMPPRPPPPRTETPATALSLPARPRPSPEGKGQRPGRVRPAHDHHGRGHYRNFVILMQQ